MSNCHMCAGVLPQSPKQGTGIKDSCELPNLGAGNQTGPLEEQCVLLTVESVLSYLRILVCNYIIN